MNVTDKNYLELMKKLEEKKVKPSGRFYHLPWEKEHEEQTKLWLNSNSLNDLGIEYKVIYIYDTTLLEKEGQIGFLFIRTKEKLHMFHAFETEAMTEEKEFYFDFKNDLDITIEILKQFEEQFEMEKMWSEMPDLEELNDGDFTMNKNDLDTFQFVIENSRQNIRWMMMKNKEKKI